MTDPSLESIARSQDRTLLLVEHLSDKLDERIEHDDAWKERTDLILMGDGAGRTGHTVRLDRLEQKAASQQWLVRALLGGVVGLVLKMLTDALS